MPELGAGVAATKMSVYGAFSSSQTHEKAGLVHRNDYAPTTHGPDASGAPATSKVTSMGDVSPEDFYHPARTTLSELCGYPGMSLG